MLVLLRRGLLRGATAGLVAIALLAVWLVAFPFAMGREANLEGIIVGSYGLGWPTSRVIAVPDNLFYVIRWLVMVGIVLLNWAVFGGAAAVVWGAFIRLTRRTENR